MLDAGFVPVEVLAPAVLPEPLLVMEAAGAVLAAEVAEDVPPAGWWARCAKRRHD